MPDEPNGLSPDVTELAQALRDLAPAPGGISRDRLLFEAGRASAASALRWAWPVAACGFAMLSVVFAGLLAAQGPRTILVERDRPVEVRVEVPVPVRVEVPAPGPGAEPSPAPPAPRAVARKSAADERDADARRMASLRRDVLRWGPEMLPEPRTTPAGSPTQNDPEIEDMLRPTPGTFAAPYGFPFRAPSMPSGGPDR